MPLTVATYTHSLMRRGFGPRTSLVWVGLLCATTAAGGTFAFIFQQSEYAIVSVVIVVLVMIFGRLFGTAEVELMSNKAKTLGKRLIRKGHHESENSTGALYNFRAIETGNEIWKELCEFSDQHEINEITFDINLPWLHESFHANQRLNDAEKKENDEWYAEVPLVVEGKIFGRVELHVSKSCRFSHHDIISNLMKLTGDIEPRLLEKSSRKTNNLAKRKN